MSLSSVFNLIRRASTKKQTTPPEVHKEIVEEAFHLYTEESASAISHFKPLADSPISSGFSSANDSDFESVSSEEESTELKGDIMKKQVEKVGISFDEFMLKLGISSQDSISTVKSVPEGRILLEPKAKIPKRDQKAEMEQMKILALEKERKIDKRKAAALKIQT